MTGDLQGLTVVSLEQAVAAPYASAKLADAGARVIKVERPEGDFARRYDSLVNGESAYFVWLNRGKESLRLDLKADGDRALLAEIVSRADVFIQNLAPGAAGRLGFGADDLRAKNPRLIVCAISGYGETGAYRDQKAYDLLVQAESGLCAINGTPEGPARVGISVCDITAGLTAAQAICQALFARERTGKGRTIEVSLFHAIADFMNVPYLQTRYGNAPPKREGLRHPTIAPYGAYPCADGKAVLIAIQNEREWARFAALLGLAPDDARFASNDARVANRAALEPIVAAYFEARKREDAIAELTEAAIAFGRLSELADLVAHPQRRLVAVATDAGTVELLAPGALLDGAPPRLGKVPSLGEHDAAIRAEFAPAAAES